MSVFVSKTEFQKRKLKQYQIAKENDWLFLLILIDTYWQFMEVKQVKQDLENEVKRRFYHQYQLFKTLKNTDS